MVFQKIIFSAIFFGLVAKSVYSVPCSPCPGQLTMDSLFNCTCPEPNLFYDNHLNKCVPFDDCTKTKTEISPDQIQKLISKYLPMIGDNITHVPLSNLGFTRDFQMLSDSLDKTSKKIGNDLPVIFAPVTAVVASEATLLFTICKTNVSCYLETVMKKPDFFKTFADKMKISIDNLMKIVKEDFEEFKKTVNTECGKNDCQLVRNWIKVADVMIEKLSEMTDIEAISAKLNEFFLFDDLNKKS